MSWTAHKNEGKRLYEQENFEDALKSYNAALNPELEAPRAEQQILLSNVVACRLKIGGSAQYEAAVENAKQCVAINPSWAKGHVRLASAYIALGGHSNDACNALQTALRHDRGNTLARQMLVRELRRDQADSYSTGRREPPQNPGFVDDPQQTSVPVSDPVDDSISFGDRFRFFCARAKSWYEAQSPDMKMLILGVVLVLFLYVGFGGRFGLESTPVRGNYGSGNAYDHYRSNRYQQPNRHNERHYEHTNSYGRGRNRDPYYDDGYGGGRNGGYGGGGGFGMGMGIGTGSIQSMIMMLGMAYMCRLAGINPLTFIMMNMMRRQRFGGGYGGGFGGIWWGLWRS